METEKEKEEREDRELREDFRKAFEDLETYKIEDKERKEYEYSTYFHRNNTKWYNMN